MKFSLVVLRPSRIIDGNRLFYYSNDISIRKLLEELGKLPTTDFTPETCNKLTLAQIRPDA